MGETVNRAVHRGGPSEPHRDPAAGGASGKEDFVRSLANGLRVLESFSETEQTLILSEVAQRSGLSRATARRMLRTLVHLGYASTDGRAFSLTPKVFSLGMGFWSGRGLATVLQPVLRRLAEDVSESSSASVLDGAEIVYIARVHTRRIMRMNLEVGSRLPAFATSMGRVLLGDLAETELRDLLELAERPQLSEHTSTDVDELISIISEVRRRGFALVDQELELGLRSVAVPVRRQDGHIAAALNVSVASGLETAEQTMSRVLPHLRQASAEASRSLAAWEQSTGQTDAAG